MVVQNGTFDWCPQFQVLGSTNDDCTDSRHRIFEIHICYRENDSQGMLRLDNRTRLGRQQENAPPRHKDSSGCYKQRCVQ